MFSTTLLITLSNITNINYTQLIAYILLVDNTYMSKIYTITNNINNKKYVGKTSRTLKERINEHRQIASSNSKSKGAIHHAISKYGIENFSIKCIEECDTNRENEREIYWIKMLETHVQYGKGYNMTKGGDGITLVREDWGSNCQSKGVSKWSIDNIHICDYDSIGLASTDILGKNRRLDGKPGIRKCCQGRQNSAHGYKWSWKGEPLSINNLREYTTGRVYGVHKDGRKKYWNCPNDCVMELTGKQSNNSSVSYSLRSTPDCKRIAHGWYLFYNKQEANSPFKTAYQVRHNAKVGSKSGMRFKGVSVTNPDDIVYFDCYKDLRAKYNNTPNIYKNIRELNEGKKWSKCYDRQWYKV